MSVESVTAAFGRISSPFSAPRPRPVSTHLLLFVLLLGLPSILLTALLVFGFAQERRREAENRVLLLAASLAQDVTAQLQKSLAVLRTLASSSSLREGDLDRFHRTTQHVLAGSRGVIRLVGPDGKILIDSLRSYREPPSDYSMPKALQIALNAAEPYITDVYQSPRSGTPFVDILLPVQAPWGARYVLVQSLAAQDFGEVLLNRSIGRGHLRAGIFDRNGAPVARSGQGDALGERSTGPRLENVSLPLGEVRRIEDNGGRGFLRAVSYTSLGGWPIAVAIADEHVSASIRQGASSVALVAAILLAMSLALVSAYTRRFTDAFSDVAAGASEGRGASWISEARDAADSMARSTSALRFSQHTLSAAIEVAGLATWGWDERRSKTLWSAEAKDVFGLDSRVEATPELFVTMLHPDDVPRHDEAWRAALSGSGVYALDYRITRPSDGRERWIQSRAVVEYEQGQPCLVIGALRDITDERQAAIALARSEERLRTALTTAQAGVWSFDLESGAAEWDDQSFTLFGRDRDAGPPDLRAWMSEILAPESEVDVRSVLESTEASANTTLELKIRTTTTPRWLLTSLCICAAGGVSRKLTGLSLDLTRRKEYEDQILLLMREVNHRSKNMLTVVSSIARQTARTNRTDFASALDKRIAALSLCQDLLVRNAFVGVDLEELVRSQLAPFTGGEARVVISGPPVVLTPAAAQTFGLAIHELATNAVKHGALGADDGALTIGWRIDDDQMFFEWTERGGPPANPRRRRRGFGSTLLTAMAEFGTRGKVQLNFPAEGCEWRLACPLRAITADCANDDAPPSRDPSSDAKLAGQGLSTTRREPSAGLT